MRRLVLLISAVVLVDTMLYAAIVPLLPEYRDDLGLSKSAAGGLTASYAAGTLIGALPASLLALPCAATLVVASRSRRAGAPPVGASARRPRSS